MVGFPRGQLDAAGERRLVSDCPGGGRVPVADALDCNPEAQEYTQHILWQLFLVSVLSILWDYFTGWHGWSLDFVVPGICLVAMLSMTIVSRVMKVCVEEYLIYSVLGCLFGIVPLIFLLTGLVNYVYLPLICVAASIIFLAAIVIYQGENIAADLKRRLHL